MDLATVIGVSLGFATIVIAIVSGGAGMVFIHVPSMAIVIGGMLCATMAHFSLGQFLGVFTIIKKTVFNKAISMNELIQHMVNYAAINRRDGALALEQEIGKTNHQFIKKGLQMLVDGQEENSIRTLMSLEIQSLEERHSLGKKILDFMASAAPAFGMIGTLIGLINMLRNLSSPDALGAGMAVALITTFYGAFLANVVFTPMAGKLGICSKQEIMSMDMTVEAICAIAQGENPTVVREKMQAFMAPKHREPAKASV